LRSFVSVLKFTNYMWINVVLTYYHQNYVARLLAKLILKWLIIDDCV